MIKAKNMTNLYWFCLSVESGGFAAASLKAKASAATLSRGVAALEEELGERLVHRNAKQFQLTAAGEDCYQSFAMLFAEFEEKWSNLASHQAELTGDIEVSCPEPFADFFLQQLAIEFMTAHPAVNIHIHFASDTQRFIEEQIDLAVITRPSKEQSLVQRQLFSAPLALAASPAYIEEHGMPERAEQLTQHKLVTNNWLPYWELKQDGKAVQIPVQTRYSVNSLRLIIQAAKAGVGICLMPKAALGQLETEGKLQAILPDVECPNGEAYLIWNDRKLISARVATFRDMIFERMNNPTEFLNRVVR